MSKSCHLGASISCGIIRAHQDKAFDADRFCIVKQSWLLKCFCRSSTDHLLSVSSCNKTAMTYLFEFAIRFLVMSYDSSPVMIHSSDGPFTA
jgi:hypothetical protein